VDSHDPQESKRWSISQDLSKEHEVLFTIDQDELPAFSPYFDPAEFVQRHPNQKVGIFRLPEELLK